MALQIASFMDDVEVPASSVSLQTWSFMGVVGKREFVFCVLSSVCHCLLVCGSFALLHVGLFAADIHHFLSRSFIA